MFYVYSNFTDLPKILHCCFRNLTKKSGSEKMVMAFPVFVAPAQNWLPPSIFVWTAATVCFLMCPQIARPRGCKVTFNGFSPLCVYRCLCSALAHTIRLGVDSQPGLPLNVS